ncbi:Mur ligase family protein [Alkalibacterium kapii]|uniref:UDP-N-acetylmuramoyl-L-alanyl-D-glutamate--2,6-diaminopimelate ligase n=1 Tax=Alkalibacterium kapii TaxID=426704 RepID=A0A511AR16_9LACT|nr:UDP-N-acetylmuramyl-tripeptide synthetase [Alkalibacterium kapii]GEK90645.1 UDP-N-acetylmuramoyl-L-alanyl-D-glutamate--2,6-diaminopimelate ligase [Alkalibacterium kapii]
MELTKLLQSINIIAKKNIQDNITINKLAYHSSEVEPNTLFVCILGFKTDGHHYAEVAVKNGAPALVVERFIEDIDVPQFLVADGREALARLSDRFYDHPSRDMRLFGVTGTNGKTTITYMTDAVFEAHGLDTGMIGTIMVKSKDKKIPSVLTTPESLDLQKYFNNMRSEGVSHVSMEVSSSALALKRTENVAFDVAAFTNIHRDHIELHGSFEAYYNAKASFIRQAPKSSIALLNIDEGLLENLTNETEAQVVSFGIENDAGHFHVTDIDMSNGLPSFTVTQKYPIKSLTHKQIQLKPFRIHLSVPGFYSIYNALTAIITGLVNDIPLSVVTNGIENFKGVERRFQILYEKDFMVIDDLFLNEDNIDAGMNALKEMDFNTIHFVHAVRGNRGVDVNRENAVRMAERFPELNITNITLTASRSHVGELDYVSDDETATIMDVMEDQNIAVDFHDELHDALESVIKRIRPNDILLITGAHGMDHGARITFELLKENKIGIDQKAIEKMLKSKTIGMEEMDTLDVS